MHPPDNYTSRVYRSPAAFRRDHPDYASAARELVRAMPDVRAMRFVAASVGQATEDRISRITVELETPGRIVWVEVRPADGRLSAQVTLNHPKPLRR